MASGRVFKTAPSGGGFFSSRMAGLGGDRRSCAETEMIRSFAG